jgi:hypothetical protein
MLGQYQERNGSSHFSLRYTRISYGKNLSTTNSPNKIIRRFPITNCIGVDASKQELSAFDGKKSFVIKNEKGLKGLKSYLNKRASSDDTVIIFESAGVYSGYLKQFCAASRMHC